MRGGACLVFAFAAAATLLSSSARADLVRGATCTVKSTLPIVINTAGGRVESVVEPGVSIEVVVAGEEGLTKIAAGEAVGVVSTLELESACAGTLGLCTLAKELVVYEKNRSDSRAYRLKPGAPVSVLKKGKTWAAVRQSDLVGFAKTNELNRACVKDRGSARSDAGERADGGEGPVDEIERGEGPGVLLLPFGLDPGAPEGTADQLFATLADTTIQYRPDAGRLGVEGSRQVPWKEQLSQGAARARRAGLAYALVGRLALDTQTKPKADPTKRVVVDDALLLQLAVVDAADGRVLKGVRARPTTALEDPWAEQALAILLQSVRAAPGSRAPTPPTLKLELPKSTPAPAQAPVAPVAPQDSSLDINWFGIGALSAGVLLGGAGAAVGALALQQNAGASALAATDPARQQEREEALVMAGIGDALAAVGVVVAAVGVFAFVSGE